MESPSERAVIALRCRPLFDSEKLRNCTSVLEFPAEDKNIVILGKNGFEFDRILSGTCQREVFDMVQPILDKVWAGYSATVMAYGQTGAGKTYTMGTGKEESSNEDEGVIPRTVKALFELNTDGAAKIFVSFTEVYNDGVYDLLSLNPTRKMQARAFRDLGLQEVAVFSGEEALKRLEEGIEARRVSETQGNEKSSRSHAIFSLHIHRYNEVDSVGTRSFVHLVDLAGSEAVGKAGNQGCLKLEGISINQGLLALSNCIRAVIQKSQHIPVRNTALTIVLQDALKGQCLLALIACISPSSRDENETAQTLRFAQAFHKIKSKPHIQKIVAQHAAKATGAIKKTNLPTPLAPRKPFSSIGNNAAYQPPNMRVSNYQFVSRRTAASPSEFESPMFNRDGNMSMASNMSSASIFSHFSEHELNEFMSNVLVDKIEKLKKDTADLVDKKIEDALKIFSNKPSIGLEVLSQPESQNDFDQNLDLDATVIDAGGVKDWGTSTPNTSMHSIQTTTQSCQTSPAVGILIDLGLDEPTREEPPLASCSSPEQPPVRKLRRSVRLSCMALPAFLMPQPTEPVECMVEKKKPRRSVRLSCMLLPHHLRNQDDEEPAAKQSRRRSCMPQTEDVVPAKKARQSMSVGTEPRKQRRSLRLSCLALPNGEDICVRDAEEFKPARKERRSIGPDILEEKLFRDSPSAGTVQEKHKRRLLELMNTESTKVIQQLPTVGPKTGYIIFCYRQIHGPYKSFEDLQSVPGLTANFLKRFFKANNIKL